MVHQQRIKPSTIVALGCVGAIVGGTVLTAGFCAYAINRSAQHGGAPAKAPQRSAVDRGNDPEEFIATFGRPDVDYVNDTGRPVPPMRMRLLEYRQASVRIVYTAGIEPARPYKWRYIGAQDLKTDQKITPEEAAHRLRSR
jgi:hypothetical protein